MRIAPAHPAGAGADFEDFVDISFLKNSRIFSIAAQSVFFFREIRVPDLQG
jgi:hypothetical protein